MAATPFDQLINIISGTTPPSNFDKMLKPLIYESKISPDQLLQAANRAINYQTAEVLGLTPWADRTEISDLRRKMQDVLRAVHDLNRLDAEEKWEMVHNKWTQDAIVEAVKLRRECHDLLQKLRKEETERDGVTG